MKIAITKKITDKNDNIIIFAANIFVKKIIFVIKINIKIYKLKTCKKVINKFIYSSNKKKLSKKRFKTWEIIKHRNKIAYPKIKKQLTLNKYLK